MDEEKAAWGPGPWVGEVDKAQWVDAATGLDCLIVRGPMGSLCGYVGVPEGHPLYGVECSQETPVLGAAPDMVLHVHGGLTYSDRCEEPTEAQWLALGKKLYNPRLLAEARLYPDGDAAECLAELRRQHAMTFMEWFDDQQARRICHVPEAGRPDKVWWFGFDTDHAGDYSPGFEARLKKYLEREREDFGEVYRTRQYVEGQCATLAAQLAAVQPPPRRVLRTE